MNEKRKWITAGRLRRAAVILAAAGLTAGAGLATAGSALAAVGTIPGGLTLSVTSGPLTTLPTWGSTTACPSGYTGSADVEEFTLTGTFVSGISSYQNTVTSPWSGTDLLGSVGSLLATNGGPTAANPGTVEWVVSCYSLVGGGGSVSRQGDLYVTATSAGDYTTSSTAPAQTGTTTTLTVTPTTGVTTTTDVSLSATVTASDGSSPAGTVTFYENGTTAINSTPISVTWSGATGTAALPSPGTTFPSSGTYQLTAVFTPTSPSYAQSTSPVTNLTVTLAGSLPALCTTAQVTAGTCSTVTNPVTINVTVAASGSLTVSVASAGNPVTLTFSSGSPSPTATGTLPNVTIMDTRNNYPGWSVMGQESAFTSSALPSTPISGNQLGWAPAAATGSNPFDGTHVVLGPTITPGEPGLGTTAQVLALAHAGYGADPTGATDWVSNATLTLDVPLTTTAGAYTGMLTITYLSSQS